MGTLLRPLARLFLLAILVLSLRAQAPAPRTAYLTYPEAEPVLRALEDLVPPELKNQDPARQAAMWPEWAKQRDVETRARLAQGEEDSLANLLLFGTSYTRHPRLTPDVLASLQEKPEQEKALVQGRIQDLVRGLVSPQSNERLRFMRHFLEGKGYRFQSDADRKRVAEYLVANLRRVLRDFDDYSRALEAARSLSDATEQFAQRSTLFENRGISLDTSLMPNFALEEALKQMQARKLLAPGSVRRVGVIGPGLDFIDKSAGYDYYPQQTIQPFALIDTLLRLGLAKPGTLQVTTFDISPRVNEHLTRAIGRTRGGKPYVVQLPLDSQRKWEPPAIGYWQGFGTAIGTPVPPLSPPPMAGRVRVRAISIRPSVVQRVTPVDLNVVWQQLDLPENQRFDLLVGTNIFVYYGVLEQSLAMVNMARMLRPGGFLLSNNALLELPGAPFRSIDHTTVVYSDRPDDGDHIVWYQRATQ